MNLCNIDLDRAISEGIRLPMKTYSPEQRGLIIDKLQKGMRETTKNIHSGYLHLGRFWNFAMVNKMHHYWGSHVKTANDLIKELNLGQSRSLLDHYARIWKTFGPYLQQADMFPPVSRLIAAHSIVEKIKNEGEKEIAIEEWTHKAETLPHEAYQNAVAKAKGQITTDECPHDEQEIWGRCKACSKFFKIVNA